MCAKIIFEDEEEKKEYDNNQNNIYLHVGKWKFAYLYDNNKINDDDYSHDQ